MFTPNFGVTTRTLASDVNHVKILLVVVFSLAPTLQSRWTKPQTCFHQEVVHRPKEEHVWTGLYDNIYWGTIG